MNYPTMFLASLLVVLFATNVPLFAETLEVGPQKPFARIEDALAKAKGGDEILIHPLDDGAAYRRVALRVRTPNLTIRAAEGDVPVVLDGKGFEYSGEGAISRAVIQFDRDADGSVVEGLTLINARNRSFNGAGVRINQANNITVRRCIIRNNDMGIMSNGSVSENTGAGQMIEHCEITDNGTAEHPGYNHNLYLGGTDVTLRDCVIARSVTGHNVKSRAHRIVLVRNRIFDSCNREIDLVDEAGNTDVPGSDAYLIGNTIAKDPKCAGNRGVIHFGRDGQSTRDGTLWMLDNTIRTPFIAPVADLSSGRGIVGIGNTFDDTGTGRKGVLAVFAREDMTLCGKDNRVPERFVLRFRDRESDEPIRWSEVPSFPEHLKNATKTSLSCIRYFRFFDNETERSGVRESPAFRHPKTVAFVRFSP